MICSHTDNITIQPHLNLKGNIDMNAEGEINIQFKFK